MGDVLARLNQWTEAEKFHKAALSVQSDHVATQLSYGNMLARNVRARAYLFKGAIHGDGQS